MLKEDKIGSLERGKYADLIGLDRNPLDPKLADDQLSDVNILLTSEPRTGKSFATCPVGEEGA